MGTALFALATNAVIELSTRAVVGAAIITIITMLAVTYFRKSPILLRLLFVVLVSALIVTSLILGVIAFNHVTGITNWSLLPV